MSGVIGGSGVVDLQVNGYGGIDFNSDALSNEAILSVCRKLRNDGVASFLPTVITDDISSMIHRIRRISKAVESNAEIAEMVGGIHIEAPSSAPSQDSSAPIRLNTLVTQRSKGPSDWLTQAADWFVCSHWLPKFQARST